MFLTFPRIMNVWDHVNASLGHNINFQDDIASGSWITDNHGGDSNFIVSVVAVVIWLIWKS